ncbi:hypothetical protein WQ57_12815 [Mesobacillus campisalis]|uniref:Uncharacterized protein n=1 Tax=Mesobacillus campisalis TaxID=1408103 RepID=A0A0M2SV81_9BACI|nr:hypothetical protein WQ57_12815 [Mesobacillus campisalis]
MLYLTGQPPLKYTETWVILNITEKSPLIFNWLIAILKQDIFFNIKKLANSIGEFYFFIKEQLPSILP